MPDFLVLFLSLISFTFYLLKFNLKYSSSTAQPDDGRTISVPLAWSWRLSEATHEQIENYEIIGDGQAVHWPEIDEDISAEGMLYGSPAPRPHAVL